MAILAIVLKTVEKYPWKKMEPQSYYTKVFIEGIIHKAPLPELRHGCLPVVDGTSSSWSLHPEGNLSLKQHRNRYSRKAVVSSSNWNEPCVLYCMEEEPKEISELQVTNWLVSRTPP